MRRDAQSTQHSGSVDIHHVPGAFYQCAQRETSRASYFRKLSLALGFSSLQHKHPLALAKTLLHGRDLRTS